MAKDTKASLAAILEPYRGKRTKLREQLGEGGIRMLADYCDQSPTTMAEFLGIGQSGCTEWLQKLGIDARKRDPHAAPDEWTLDDWRDLWLRQTQAIERAIEYKWRVPAATEFVRLHFVGDAHFGNAAQDSKRLLDFIGWLKEPEQKCDRWILLGDLFEVRGKANKGSAPLMPQEVCYELALSVFEPVMGQCILCHAGNHDLRIMRDTDMPFDPVRDFAKHFEVPYHGLDGFHILNVHAGKHEQRYVGYCHHGYGSARTPGARRNQLVAKIRETNADYIAMAHLHDRDGGAAPMFGPDEAGEVEEWSRPVVRAGSFVRHAQGSFARNAGIPPGAKGAATLHLYTTKHSAHARS
jgi:hypothetical protein